MLLTRRLLIGTLAAAPTLARAQTTPSDPRMAERSIGKPDAKVTVQEYFSLTCTHCAAFQKETFPDVKAKLIDTGAIRYIWRDFPLDQVALTASMVARALPPAQYEPFVTALLSTQDRWAFARNINPIEELAKLAALAGMPRSTFDATVKDNTLKQAILTEQGDGEKTYGVNSTPTFVMNGKVTAGAIGYDAFAKAVAAASS